MLLFHGTRKSFNKFDSAFFDTGEHSIGVGFYFTDSLKGACAHASRYAPHPGEPLVYVCEVREALILDRWKPISKHSPAVQKHWETLPLAQYCAKDSRDWFEDLFRTLPIGNPTPEPSESQKYTFLRERGFHVMYDSDGSFTDGYLSGLSIVVLDERVIDIIEVLPVEQLHLETIGEPKQYEIADTLSKSSAKQRS